MATEQNLIRVGNGLIKIDSTVMNISKGKVLLIQLNQIKGPCNDDTCQIIYKPEAEILEDRGYATDDHYLKTTMNDTIILVDKKMWESIQKGRQSILIKKGISGKIKIKGFTPYD